MVDKNLKPPIAEIKPHEMTIHDHTRVDNYYWLKEKGSPQVIEYLEAENEYTNKMMAHTKGLQKKIYEEMVGRIQETDSTAPIKHGDYYYYSRTEEGKQYSIQCRREGTLEAEEKILLDLNQLAEGRDFLRLGAYKVRPYHRILAYYLDLDGRDNYTIYFMDLISGELLPDQIKNVTRAAEWANDNRTIYYTTKDHAKRSYRLYRHTLGADSSEDALIYQEVDAIYRLGISKTKDEKYMLLTLGSSLTTEVRVLEADDPGGDFRIVHPREKGLKYSLRHRDGVFYILTNEDALNFKVMTVNAVDPGKSNWKEYIPHRKDVLIETLDMFSGYMAVYERENGLKTLRIIDFEEGDSHVEFPEPVYTIRAVQTPEFDSTVVRFIYSSLTTANSVIDYDMSKSRWTLVKQTPVLGGYDPSDYTTERLFATANDGIKVPISIVYRKGFKKDGSQPCLLAGYGSYGSSQEPAFNSNNLSLLDRGVVYATAHVRGGGEMGEWWWEDGSMLNKMNTFTDYIACSEHLIESGHATPDGIVATGGSAGGLLMGAVANMRPDLYRVIVADVPFVDVLNTMLDASIPLTVGEYDEWGNPNEEEYYFYMKSYSPYDNVAAQNYPDMLITASLNDPRVQYWEPAKWAARLRVLKTGGNLLLLKTNMGAGHGGSSGRYERMREWAFEYAFVLDRLGLAAEAEE